MKSQKGSVGNNYKYKYKYIKMLQFISCLSSIAGN